MHITLTLAQLALFCQLAARFQDPAFGDEPDEATIRALQEMGFDLDGHMLKATTIKIVL